VLQGQEPDLHRGPVTYEIEHRRAANLDAWLVDIIRDRAESKLADVMDQRQGSVEAAETGPGNRPILGSCPST
jgi:hypothetical protein